MEDNEHHRKSTKDNDHFSRVMFGNRQPRGTSHAKGSSETRTDWFFGSRKKENEQKPQQEEPVQSKVENFMNNVDIELLFDTYDNLIKTKELYKPLFKGMAPIFSKITGKFKK